MIDNPEQWQVVSNESTNVETFGEYGERFQIEEGFLDEKSGLFELQAYKLRDAKSLEAGHGDLDRDGTAGLRSAGRGGAWGLSYLKTGHKAMSYALSRGQRFFRTLSLRGGPDPEPPKPRKRGQPSSLEALKDGRHVSFPFLS